MGNFYRDQLDIELSLWERRSLFSGWHFLNFTSDIIIIVGTAYKIVLNLNVRSLFLSVAEKLEGRSSRLKAICSL